MKLKTIIVVSALSASVITSNVAITSSEAAAAARIGDLVQLTSKVDLRDLSLTKLSEIFSTFFTNTQRFSTPSNVNGIGKLDEIGKLGSSGAIVLTEVDKLKLTEIDKRIKYFDMDIRQETYLRLLERHTEKGWDDIRNMKNYAYTVAKNIEKDQIKALNKHHEIAKELQYINLAYAGEIAHGNFRDTVYSALENHPEILVVVNLHLFDGLPLREVAEKLNRSRTTVYDQWEKGVLLLRDTAERLGYKKLGSLIPELNANQFRNAA